MGDDVASNPKRPLESAYLRTSMYVNIDPCRAGAAGNVDVLPARARARGGLAGGAGAALGGGARAAVVTRGRRAAAEAVGDEIRDRVRALVRARGWEQPLPDRP